MATTTLTLYRKCKIEPNKNFIVDDIEAYLATLSDSKTVTGFQYQRFDLLKIIKLNLSQDFQTKTTDSSVGVKFNYLKMSTTIKNNENIDDVVNYYYFITGYKQVAEKTVELYLEMDTLNTFSLSGTGNNQYYGLSNKTVVTREHKDRFTADVYYTDSVLPQKSIPIAPYVAYTEGDPMRDKKYAPDIQRMIDERTQETTVSFGLGVGTGHGEGRLKIKVYNSASTNYSLAAEYTCHNNIDITPYDDSVDFTLTLLDDTTEVVEVFPNQKVVIEVLKISSNSVAQQNLTNMFVFCFMRGNAQFYLRRVVDQYNEGLSTTLFKQQEETLYDGDGEKHWMLAYRNDENTSTTVDMLLYPEDPLTITTQSSSTADIYPDLIPNKVNQEEWVKFMHFGDYEAGNYIEVNGTQYEVVSASTVLTGNKVHGVLLRKQNANDTVFKNVLTMELNSGGPETYTEVATNVGSVEVHGWGNAKIYTSYYTNRPASGSFWQDFWIGTKSNITSGNVDSWKDVKLYDTKLIKAFIFPYCPSQYLHGRMDLTALPGIYNYATSPVNAIKLRTANDNDFSYELEFGSVNPQAVLLPNREDLVFEKEMTRDSIYESKLYHSDYYQPKFVYDSFSYTFNLEDVDISEWINTFGDPKYFSATYTVSTNIVSKFAFQFSQYATTRASQDYEAVLCIERNNEKALYNSDYLTYIKNGGYSYDQKKANSQNAINGITTALSIVGAVASFAAAPYTGGSSAAMGAGLIAGGVGLATAATAGVARGIYTAQEQDKAISQKMLQSQNQANTVRGSEDLDILTVITQNKAKIVVYKLSDLMQKAMWDLFHYCGYATYEYKVPTHTSRLYFNFVQADIDYEFYTFNEEIADDIKEKWAQGVTYIHKVRNSEDTAYIWDMNQMYENIEVSLLPVIH